jgi:light-regulated signal transduction histidine kinase (bacteriophytochrome)
MSVKNQYPEGAGLEFFARTSAAISHEMKNVLAIINENAGLLEDIVLMAGKGVPLSCERLDRMAATVRKQILRADGIVKKMNRFAHSLDKQSDWVDLYEAAVFVTAICDRMIGLNGVTVDIIAPDNSVKVKTHLFYLQNILWICIEYIMEFLKTEKTILIGIHQHPSGAEIRFQFKVSPADVSIESRISEHASALAQYLQAQLMLEPNSGILRIRLPKAIRR